MHPETGELLDAKKNSIRSIDHEKAEKNARLARPVFVHTPAHIRAHSLIGFTALLIVRLIQYAMGKKERTGIMGRDVELFRPG